MVLSTRMSKTDSVWMIFVCKETDIREFVWVSRCIFLSASVGKLRNHLDSVTETWRKYLLLQNERKSLRITAWFEIICKTGALEKLGHTAQLLYGEREKNLEACNTHRLTTKTGLLTWGHHRKMSKKYAANKKSTHHLLACLLKLSRRVWGVFNFAV